MLNHFQDWFVRVLKLPPHRESVRDMRELDKTWDDHRTNAPKRKKQSLKRAPERK